MTLKIFTVFDCKAKAYLPPFYSLQTASGLRAFEEVCNTPSHDFHKYPTDFSLFEIGTFDDQDGTIQLLPAALNLGIAQDFIRETHPTNTTPLRSAN